MNSYNILRKTNDTDLDNGSNKAQSHQLKSNLFSVCCSSSSYTTSFYSSNSCANNNNSNPSNKRCCCSFHYTNTSRGGEQQVESVAIEPQYSKANHKLHSTGIIFNTSGSCSRCLMSAPSPLSTSNTEQIGSREYQQSLRRRTSHKGSQAYGFEYNEFRRNGSQKCRTIYMIFKILIALISTITTTTSATTLNSSESYGCSSMNPRPRNPPQKRRSNSISASASSHRLPSLKPVSNLNTLLIGLSLLTLFFLSSSQATAALATVDAPFEASIKSFSKASENFPMPMEPSRTEVRLGRREKGMQ